MNKAKTVFEKMAGPLNLNTIKQLKKHLSSKGGLTIGTKEGKELLSKYRILSGKASILSKAKSVKGMYGVT
jgi:hypothetical protein